MATTALKIPKSLAQVADLYFTTMNARLAKQREADALEAQEKLLKNHLIDNLPKSQADGIKGKLVQVSIEVKQRVDVKDWDAFYAHIKKKGEFELLNRAPNMKAIKERWEKNVKIPGLEPVDYKTLSYSSTEAGKAAKVGVK